MATPTGDGGIVLNTKVNTDGLKKGFKKMKDGVKEATGSFSRLGGVIATAFSVSAIIKFSKESTAAYQIQMQNETKLATVMRQRMGASNENIKSILDLASAQQQLGIIGDEVQLAGAQQLATFASQTSTLQVLLPAMNNLVAQQKGFNATAEDAVNIGNLMGKVLQGQTAALRRVGVTFTEEQDRMLKYGTESEKAATLAQVITDNVGEMNKALAQTDIGRQKQLSNTMGDIKERFGQAITQIAVLFLPALQKVAEVLSYITEGALKLSQTIAETFGEKANEAQWQNQAIKGQKKLTQAVDETAEAQKKAMLGFDKLNILSSQDSKNKEQAQGGLSQFGILPEQVGESATAKTSKELTEFMQTLSVALTAIGVILLMLGHFGWGIGFIIAGAGAFAVTAMQTSDGLEEFKTKMIAFLGWLSVAFLAIGLLLVMTGHITPLSIGFIIAGATGLVATVAINPNATKDFIKKNGGIIAGISVALLAVGIILCLVGNLPLGIGLIVAGGANLITVASLNWDWIVDKCKKVGTAIKDFFLDVWEGIKLGFKSMVNGIIEFANIWIDGLNALLLPLRGIIYGIAKAFGSKISFGNVKIPRIPYLAQGAVIPPNREFMAVLGDQKHGTNIEAPENLIRKIVREETGGKSLTIKATGSMAQLIQYLHLELADENTRATVF